MTSIKTIHGSLILLLLAGCVGGSSTPLPDTTPTATQTVYIASISPSAPSTPTGSILPEVRIENGDKAYRNGDYLLAQSEYQAALTSSASAGTSAAALWGLGLVNFQTRNFAKAEQDLWQLINNYPNDGNQIRAYFILGEIYSEQERFLEAAQAYTIYVTLRPRTIDYYVQERRGDAYSAARNFPEAIAAYQAALDAEHIIDDVQLRIKLAQTYAQSNDAITALGMYNEIAGMSTNDYVKAQMHLYSGQLLLSLGQVEEAYQHYLTSVENYPAAYDSYTMLVELVNAGIQVDDLNRGLVDYFAGQYGFALDAFDRYMAFNPAHDGTARYYSALTLRQMGLYQQSVDSFSSFINDHPQNRYWQTAWDEKAFTLWAYLDNFDAAANTLLGYRMADPTSSYSAEATASAGRIFERSGNLLEAARIWESVANDYPESEIASQAIFWAGLARYRNEQFPEALTTFQRANFMSPSDSDRARALLWIGITNQQMGDLTAATSAWQESAAIDPTNYYSLRSKDLLFNRPPFQPTLSTGIVVDLAAEKLEADSWLRVTFGLPSDTDLTGLGALADHPRLIAGTELWYLGLLDEARFEFESLRGSLENDPLSTYLLANYLLELGLYRPAIFATRQVLTLAGLVTQKQTLAAPRYFNHIRYGLYYSDLIFPASEQEGFDPLFLLSVMRQESLFEGFVRSSAGARGLMQIIPETGAYIAGNLGWPTDYTAEDLYRPLISITLGANYLKNNRIRFNGDLFAALAAYNAGPGNAEIWFGLSDANPDLLVDTIRYEETRNYIRGIYEIYAMYEMLYSDNP